MSSLQTPGPVPTALVAQPPPPAPTAQALDTLLNAFFNCAIYTPAHAEFILATIAKQQVSDIVEMIYWLFDTACGNHLTYSVDVFTDGARSLTENMRTADGSPIPALSQGTAKCGFNEVKHCPTSKFHIFSKMHAQKQGMKVSLSPDDVFIAYSHCEPHKLRPPTIVIVLESQPIKPTTYVACPLGTRGLF